MKYKFLKREKEKVLQIPSLDGGVNCENNSSLLAECEIAEGKNVFLSEGMLKTRKGINTTLENIIDISRYHGLWSAEYYLTNTTFIKEGKSYKIAYVKIEYDDSNCYVAVFGIDEKGGSTSFGEIRFGRSDEVTFYKPQSLNFFVAKAQNGGGIFAFVGAKNVYNQAFEYRLYEINSDFSTWTNAYNYYVPTVYINGRGNRYSFAENSNQTYSEKPITLESLNVLSGAFYAYYTSDGYSDTFRLPYTSLANKSVSARVYYDINTYTDWIVYADETKVTKKFLDYDVTMNVNREKGIVYFTINNEAFSVPMMDKYSANNIRIMAHKDLNEEFEALASTNFNEVLDSRIIFSGGNQKNRFFYCNFDNPFYFPQLQLNEIGDPADKITGLCKTGRDFFAFKKSEIYKVSLSEEKNLNTTALLFDNGSIFKSCARFEFETVSNTNGVSGENKITQIDNSLIWMENDGGIYTFSSSYSPVLLSGNAKNYLAANFGEKASITAVGKNCFIYCGNKIAVMKYEKASQKLFFWELPEKAQVLGVINTGEPIFLCKNPESTLGYTAFFEGESDAVVSDKAGVFEIEHKNVGTFIKTKSFSLGKERRKKRINSAVLELFSKGKVKIIIASKTSETEFYLPKGYFTGESAELVKLIVNLYGVREFTIIIEGESAVSFGGADIYYSVMKL